MEKVRSGYFPYTLYIAYSSSREVCAVLANVYGQVILIDTMITDDSNIITTITYKQVWHQVLRHTALMDVSM